MTGHWRDFHPSEVDEFVELRLIYDGWSVLKLKDGTWINRWADPKWRRDAKRSPTIQHRYTATERWIKVNVDDYVDREPGAHLQWPVHPFDAA